MLQSAAVDQHTENSVVVFVQLLLVLPFKAISGYPKSLLYPSTIVSSVGPAVPLTFALFVVLWFFPL